MTIQNKQVNIVTDLNVNSNNIIDAKINAYNNTITNLAVNNFTSGAIKTSIGNSEDASDTAIPTEKAVRTAVDGLLNEFIVTEEIFETYMNQYGFVDLNDLFDNFDLNHKVINLNGFNYLMNELTLVGSPFARYEFKNGNIFFDSVGMTFGSDISEGCSQALNAENCDLIFKDCIFDAQKLYDSTKPVIALNGCFLEFHNCNIDILFISEKTFIETLDFNNINFDDTDVYLSENSSYNYNGTDNNFSITGIKTNGGGLVTASNARIEINNNSTTGNYEPEHKFLVTAQDTTTRFEANNAEILIYGYGNKKRSLDINLDNKDIHIVNSTIDGDIYVRRESEFEIEQNYTYNKGDIFYKFSDILESWSDRSDIIDTITVNGTTFATAVNNTSDIYKFEYNGSNWELDGENVILTDYGITYTLQPGKSLESGCDIHVNFVYNAVLGFKVSANTFTPTSTDLNYLNTCVQADEIFRIGVEPVYDFNNSIIINNVDPEDFFFRNKKGTFCVNRLLSNAIETEDFYTGQLNIGNSLQMFSYDYFLPINVNGLSANNVKDAISELASQGGGGSATTTWFSSCSIDNTSSTTATDVAVDSRMFTDHIATNGLYTFSYNGASWSLDNATVSLDTYGISFDGNATSGDTIVVSLNSIAGYTLSTGINTINTVLINGLEQVPLVHYRVNNGTITFSTPLAISDYVGVR